MPEVTTSAAAAKDSTTITASGYVTNAYDQPIKVQGFVWCLFGHGPTIADHVVNCGNAYGTFDGVISGLSPHTTYSVSAYAEIGNVPGYGSMIVVTTP